MPQTATSTQQHVNIAQIKDGVVITRTGDLRMVVEVTPVNFALRSEDDQNVIVGQYQNFLNSLTFPIQVVILSRRLDLHPYLAQLEGVVDQQPSELLRLQVSEYTEFVRRLTTLVNIMDKKFYVVVPFTPPPTQKASGLKTLFVKRRLSVAFSPQQFAQSHQQLMERVTTVETGLNSIGLKTSRLSTKQLIELYYYMYNPEEAAEERLTEDVEEMRAPIIQKVQEAVDSVQPVSAPTIQMSQTTPTPMTGPTQPAHTPPPQPPINPQPAPDPTAQVENKATIMNS